MQNGVEILGIIIVFFGCTISGFSQKIKTETGTAQVKLEKNMTKEQTYKKVEELAKINAIENAFNSYVSQESNITVNSGKSDFRIIGTTKVKGEWIETLDKKLTEDTRDEIGQFGKEKSIWITCTIKGRIKEATPKSNIEFAALSCPKLNCRSTTFTSGEQLYLYFKSPLDGYLSVYLDDGNTVNRLLPYNSVENSNSVRVKADQEYFFFVKGNSNPEFGKPDEFILYTSKEKEYNSLYIVFSEINYYKPMLNQARTSDKGYLLPKSLSIAKFEEWLSNNRATLDDFIDRTVDIEIISSN
ncbi:MAG: hypothetical protein JZU47_10175 [Prolixibacteraceae bacterium]|nr:hypothetical protein [Prolixibacteraceae bacterium]